LKKTIQEKEKYLEGRIKSEQSERRASQSSTVSPLEQVQRKRLKERRKVRSNMRKNKRNKVEPAG